MKILKASLCALVLVLASCGPQLLPRKFPPPSDSTGTVAPPRGELTTAKTMPEWIAIIFEVHPNTNCQELIETLERNPQLQLTLIFPPGYFELESRTAYVERFAKLQNEKQIEIALQLENQPNLPLISNLKLAGEDVRNWGFQFAWMDDAAEQVARGSGRYSRRWSQLPTGFKAPYGALTQPVMKMLTRFRLSWVLSRPDPEWGVKFFSGTALLVPEPIWVDSTLTPQKAAQKMTKMVIDKPFSYIDAAKYPDAQFSDDILSGLLTSGKPETIPFVTVSRLVNEMENQHPLPPSANPFVNDYSAWVQTPHQKRAWLGLANAREALETYKNSGRANLTRLDAAMEEICMAESGPFLLSLGKADEDTSLGQRNFLATLANIYRLAGAPVPSNLNNWFASRGYVRSRTGDNDGDDRPFFEESANSLTWNDPSGDDDGTGDYQYPLGTYAKGAFDMRDFTVSWDENLVSFSISVAEPLSSSQAILPMADIYIDVNRLRDAGSNMLLKNRGQGVIDLNAAWEYAISFTPRSGALYQGLPGGEERLISNLPASGSKGKMTVKLSRKVLRGDPKRWRVTVALGGAQISLKNEAPVPIPIQMNQSQQSFGGAPGPKMPPRYIDLLAEGRNTQHDRLKVYSSGTVILPYVEAQ